MSPTGSSPHTRGLRACASVCVRASGIIPAHAGFTSAPSPRVGRPPDHPRTRGVYGITRRGERPTERIIPAHAGFTPSTGASPMHPSDHPRTRGVYRGSDATTAAHAGSSPHTRGLRGPRRGLALCPGIIPAHAGFTSRSRSCSSLSQDHPRTRGVYVIAALQTGQSAGSSPHTRGLPSGQYAGSHGRRIIPAHAGFTLCRGHVSMMHPDHPRTRGVYSLPGACLYDASGSSPHTRGLLPVGQAVHSLGGIIPAHAGFTPRPRRPGRPGRDHPRTRGVYSRAHAAYDAAIRIIPAHAGFTSVRSVIVISSPDHPRTRGVYPSPTTQCLPRPRIIPAHAGFTLMDPLSVSPGPDHPRTRGVYHQPMVSGASPSGSSPHTRGLHLAILGIPTVLESTTPRFPSLLT